MTLCPACASLYHGRSAFPAPKYGVFHCEACGDRLQSARRSVKRPIAAMFAGLALLAGLGAAANPSAVVAWAPGAAPMFAALGLPLAGDGLAIARVHARLSREGDKSLLVVEGELFNPRSEELRVPELAVALDGADGAELYAWRAHAPKGRIAPGERLSFRTRLESPPPGAFQALVKFAAVGDKVALAGGGR